MFFADDIPLFLEDFLNYMSTIKGRSEGTVKEYYYDLRLFLKYIKKRYRMAPRDLKVEEVDIYDMDIEVVKKIKLQDIFAYMTYIDRERKNSPRSRARKVASVRALFNYLHSVVKIIDENPANELETPKVPTRQPSYLNLNEAKKLLEVVGGTYKERDRCIITLFLNCGMRLSELSGIDISKIKGDILTVIGKGNKERTIYLNNSCVKSIENYIKVRPNVDEDALFISKRNQRMSKRAIQHMIKKYIVKAGLDPEKYSVHKLRHTAATLMYKHGAVDIRALQQILGHQNVSTTQIYTHVDDEQLRKAVKSNPLSED